MSLDRKGKRRYSLVCAHESFVCGTRLSESADNKGSTRQSAWAGSPRAARAVSIGVASAAAAAAAQQVACAYCS
ncbi:hypothetical protein EVAR_87771_1 [Eumeta japonica]|uniref:Uncharacterized protein n=1 Tax=Eumeta variegata TaxID=151549 RepID=A0A4C1X767_EUMVA|nr:hypothetical protein EVAR_87771_1 [Eumeta japonica]